MSKYLLTVSSHLLFARQQELAAPAHPRISSLQVRSRQELQRNKWREGSTKQGKTGKTSPWSMPCVHLSYECGFLTEGIKKTQQ